VVTILSQLFNIDARYRRILQIYDTAVILTFLARTAHASLVIDAILDLSVRGGLILFRAHHLPLWWLGDRDR
jgi:hypothetical protein